MKLALDWSAHDAYGQGDAYADVPAQGEGFGKAAALCISSRQCQQAQGQPGDKGVMCPSYRTTQDDQHSTRGRAQVLRAALSGALGDQPFLHPQLDAAMDLCVACKGCKRECPNGVDMAALRTEALAQRWQQQPPPWRTRLFAALPMWLPRLQRWRVVVNALQALRARVPAVARLAERCFGLAASRSLPRLAARPFNDAAAIAAQHSHHRLATAAAGSSGAGDDAGTANVNAAAAPAAAAPPRELLLLVDCFARHLDPQIAHAALAVLRAGGYRVHLLQPDAGGALCCGRPAWSAGLVDQARAQAQRLLAALAPHLAAGRAVVGLEPSCLSMLRDEFGMLGLDAPAVQALGRSALQLEEFLAREHDAKRLQLLLQALPPAAGGTGRSVHVHGHCHQKAFGTLKAMRKLLALVPGLQVQWIESSCCGMAGSFGYEAEHQAQSRAMAELALLPAVRTAAPDALILASGTSCRHQIRDGAQREALHLAQLLALALVPDDGSPLSQARTGAAR